MLIKLLSNAGFAPDPSKIVIVSNGMAKMTSDIIMGVKIFQAHHKLPVTGDVDSATLKKLKQYSK